MNSQPPSLTRADSLNRPIFEKQAQDGQARAGRLALAHGQVLTPIFMPVGTYGAVKGVPPAMLEALGAQIILGNTFHLWLRPGLEVDSRPPRAAWLCELDASHADRLRRLSGLVAW